MNHRKAVSALFAMTLASAGCSSDSTEPIANGTDSPGVGGATMGLGSAGSPALPTPQDAPVSIPPTNQQTNSQAGGFIDDSPPPAVPTAGATDCAGVVMEPETLIYKEPVMMYIVLDNSKSMIEGAKAGEPTKWEQAVKAFTEFVRDPSSKGIDVGIQYFQPEPPPEIRAEIEARRQAALLAGEEFTERDGRYSPNRCDGVAHGQSAVDVVSLPEGGDAVVESLAGANPRHGTPTVGALKGGVNFCDEFQKEHPDEQCVVIFVTDGQPNGCGLKLACHKGYTPNALGQCVDPKSEGVLTPIVQEAHDDNQVDVYTVGMDGVGPDGFDLLDKLAIVGGTDCTPGMDGGEACNVTESGGAGLLKVLNQIRDTIVMDVKVPCRWVLPPAPNGKTLNPNLVNVSLQLRGEEVPLGRVATEADCGGVQGGWYYDQPHRPTEIRTCPQTCQIVQENPDDVRASLEFGCATTLADPK